MILLALFAIALLPSLALALTFTREVVDHVVATRAVKIEVCETVAPPCVTTEGSNPLEAAKCLYENAFSGDCISAPQTLVFGELAVYEKNSTNDTQPPTLYVVLFNDVVYRGDSISFDYYYVGDDPHNLPDAARGGEYWWPDGGSGKGLKTLTAQRLDELNPDFEPYGWRSVTPSYFMTYYEPNGELLVYLNLADKHYKLVSVKKEVKNKEWKPPEKPETPAAPSTPAATCSQRGGFVCPKGTQHKCTKGDWVEASDSPHCCKGECVAVEEPSVTPLPNASATPTPQCFFNGSACCLSAQPGECDYPPPANCGVGWAAQANGCSEQCKASWRCAPTVTPTPIPECVLRDGSCCKVKNLNECMSSPPNECGAGLTPRVQVCNPNCTVTWECIVTPTPSPSPTPTPSATPSPTPSPSPCPTPTTSATPSPSPSASPSVSPSPSPSSSPSPSPSTSPSPEPSSSPTPTPSP